jgi:hypothetical protein
MKGDADHADDTAAPAGSARRDAEGVSGAMMVVAALGLIPPTLGAVLQEALDVAVILNALRAR